MTSDTSLARLGDDLEGHLVLPGDSGYDMARTVFYGGIDRRPAAIACVANATDVSRVISFVRESGAELAVRSGGHSIPGFSTTEGGVVLDLRDMRKLDIDVDGRTAWAESGLKAGEYTAATAEHGLATGFGDTGSVGLGGITLGGGIGFLSRKHGLTIDSLLAAEIVTAEGEVLRVDAESHPDLFWAIRGGGGNFGVATRFQFRLHEVPTAVGGMLILPAKPDVIASFVEEADAAPDELSTIVNVMTAPPMPFIPEEYHGRPIVLALICYAGDVEAGERVMERFRGVAEPIVDMVQPISYPEMFMPDEEEFHPVAVSRNMFTDEFDRSLAEKIIDRIEASTAMMSATQLRILGGAIARVPADETAFAHRDRRMMVNVAAIYAEPEEAELHEGWVTDLAGSIRRDDAAMYVNFVGKEGQGHVEDAYAKGAWDRLREIKGRYDPTNLFRLNHNIPPR